jgi:hypothetical protein
MSIKELEYQLMFDDDNPQLAELAKLKEMVETFAAETKREVVAPTFRYQRVTVGERNWDGRHPLLLGGERVGWIRYDENYRYYTASVTVAIGSLHWKTPDYPIDEAERIRELVVEYIRGYLWILE